MNRDAMLTPRARLVALFLSLALLSACSEPPLAGSDIGGAFELVDGRGAPVRWDDFDGRYRMVYFGYTYCPDVCPLDVQHMMQGYARFQEVEPDLAARVRPIFISIDPARDTPAKVAEFAAAFSKDLLGLTGTPEQVARAAKAFAVYYEKGKDAGGGSYLMDHSRAAYLMGPDGEPIALLPVEVNDKGVAVAAELAKWVS